MPELQSVLAADILDPVDPFMVLFLVCWTILGGFYIVCDVNELYVRICVWNIISNSYT